MNVAIGLEIVVQQRLFDFLDELKGFSQPDVTGWHFIRFVQNLGGLGAHIWFADGTPDDHDFRLANASTYAVEGILEVNAETSMASRRLPKKVARGGLPIRAGWEVERRQFDQGGDDYRAAEIQLGYDKRRNSLIIPLLTRGKYGTSGISIYADEPEHVFDGWLGERGSLITHAAAATHLAMQAYEANVGQPRLSPRERDCAVALSKGLRTQEIAARLKLSESAVNLYISNARRKLDASTRQELVAKAFRTGEIF